MHKKPPIIINPPVITVANGKARISSQISIDGGDQTLWFEFDEAFRDYLTDDTLDAFVTATVLPAILRGQDIQVNGPMSSRLYYNLSNHAIPLLCDYMGKPRVVTLIPTARGAHFEKKGTGVLSGFSGGVDSFCHYYNHSGGRSPADFEITHFAFNNVGSHGQDAEETDKAIFRKRYAHLQKFAASENKPLIAVDSNLDSFTGANFERTHTIRNVAVAQLMQKVMCKLLYASSITFSETKLVLGYDMSKLDPVILPLLSTERLECYPAGAQMTRVEKTVRIADMPASKEYLDVCVAPRYAPEGYLNCSACGKCMRTQMTLDIAGRLEEYGNIFVLDRYRDLKNVYFIEILTSKSSLPREVRNFIRQSKFPVPRVVRAIALFYPSAMASFITAQVTPRMIHRPRLTRLINKCLSW